MSLLLHIDTAVQSASVCLSEDENVLAELVNPSERDSASWLHLAIQDLLQKNGKQFQDLSAIAVSAGPGSYTGLRVGMAAAKGLCYALDIPFITISTLQAMAASAHPNDAELLCPMIDARRMEVFTAIYDQELNEVMPVTNMILDEGSFSDWLNKHTICFFGNGSEKAKTLINHRHASFVSLSTTARSMVSLAAKKFFNKEFTDLAYSEPAYGKDFYSPISKKNY